MQDTFTTMGFFVSQISEKNIQGHGVKKPTLRLGNVT